MIRHIVLWRLKKELSEGERQQAYERIKAGFEALPGRIPGLLKMQIALDASQGPDSSDLILYSEFDSAESVKNYETHDLHHALAPMVREIRIERRVADFEA